MKEVIIVGGRSLGKTFAQELAKNLDVCIAAKQQIEENKDVYLPNKIIIPYDFGEIKEQFDEPKSKYINKPRHNFKRR